LEVILGIGISQDGKLEGEVDEGKERSMGKNDWKRLK
jgi:hypothetical protein